MKKTVKIMAFVMCAVMLVVGTMFATYAYLTSETDTMTNTFTFGKVAISLYETKTDEYGVIAEGSPVTAEGNDYIIVPGRNYVKDPTISVAAGSEACYVFVKVVNNLSAIEASAKNKEGTATIGTIAEQMAAFGWTALTDVENVYYYTNGGSSVVTKNTQGQTVIPVFTNFAIKDDVVNNTITAAQTIEITAYACQADGFADPAAAWTAASFN